MATPRFGVESFVGVPRVALNATEEGMKSGRVRKRPNGWPPLTNNTSTDRAEGVYFSQSMRPKELDRSPKPILELARVLFGTARRSYEVPSREGTVVIC